MMDKCDRLILRIETISMRVIEGTEEEETDMVKPKQQ